MSIFKESKTERGFGKGTFFDKYGTECYIQESSIATEDCIWLGVSDANPIVMAADAERVGIKTEETCGWVPYPVPREVLLTTQMHLTIKQVEELIPVLQNFVKTGEVQIQTEIPTCLIESYKLKVIRKDSGTQIIKRTYETKKNFMRYGGDMYERHHGTKNNSAYTEAYCEVFQMSSDAKWVQIDIPTEFKGNYNG